MIPFQSKPLFKHWLFAFCFGGMAAAAAQFVDADPNEPGSFYAIRRNIMDSQIQPLYLSITSITDVDLDSLISDLSRLEVSGSQKSGQQIQSEDARPSPSAETPTETVALQESIPQEPENRQPASSESTAPKPSEVSEISGWLQSIDQIENPVDPMALGNLLFQQGYPERAARFYQQALEKTDGPESADWQWAMYQRATCLRLQDPAAAGRLYDELISKAPNCPWMAVASAQQATLTWYQKNKSDTFKRIMSDPNSF